MTPTNPPSPDVSSSGGSDRLYDPGPARIEDMPEILQLEKLDQLVDIYDEMVVSDSYATDTGPNLVQIEEKIAEAKKKLLKDAGFVVEETGRTEEQTRELEFADGVLDRAIRANKSDWIGHTTADGGHDGLRNEIFRELLRQYYKPRRAVEDEPPLLPETDRAKYSSELEAIREMYAKKLAERSKKMGLFERPRTIAEMAAVREEMADYIGALATEMMDDFEAQGIPHDVWVDKIDAFISAEMAAVVSGMEAARADDFRNRSKVVQWGLNKWASWEVAAVERQKNESLIHHFGRSVLNSMTKLNSWKKAGVFMGLGVGIGALAVPAFGFAVGTLGIAGGAAFVSKQIARSLVGAKLDSTAGAETIAERQAAEITSEMADATDATHYELLQLAETMAEGYREHNRNRLLGGMAISVAAGATVGELIHRFVDFNVVFGRVGEYVQSIFNHGSGGHNPLDNVPPPESGQGVDAHPNKGVSPSDELRYGPTEAPTNPGGKTEVIKEYLKEHGAANRIDKGEGWFQTFKELGVKREDWHDILQRVGPKLHDVQYSGVRAAYWDGDAHEWRINMTENHKMSPEALKIIVNDANNHDALKHALDFNNQPAGSGAETGINTQGVKLWEGAAPEQVLQKAYPGLTSRQAFLDINELYDKLGPKNVFEDVTLSEHTANNIWIDDTTGATQLTPDAQALWNQMHPEGKMLEQAIAEGRSANINIVTHGERWTNVIDKLKQIGITDVSKERYGSVLRQLWPQIKDLEYGDGTPVASLDRHGNMIMNESPTKVLDSEALRRLVRLLYKNNYNLAA